MNELGQIDITPRRRQCVGTNRAGEQCGRAPIPGGSVCTLHGGGAPQVREKANLRITGMVEPALDVFQEVVDMWRSNKCATCGKPTGDPWPAIQVAKQILDRAGFGVHSKVEITKPTNPFADMDDYEIKERLESMLKLVNTQIAMREAYIEEKQPVMEGDAAVFYIEDGDDTAIETPEFSHSPIDSRPAAGDETLSKKD
jgi:hypothetical protein